MDRLRQALDTHDELCDAFDAYLLADAHEDAEGKRIWLTHRFINGGEKAMHALAEAARSVLDAPRYYMCFHESYEARLACRVWGPDDGQECGWVLVVRLVDDPQEGGE